MVGELEQIVDVDDEGFFATTLALRGGSNRIELFHEERSLGPAATVVYDWAAPVVRVLEPSAPVISPWAIISTTAPVSASSRAISDPKAEPATAMPSTV